MDPLNDSEDLRVGNNLGDGGDDVRPRGWLVNGNPALSKPSSSLCCRSCAAVFSDREPDAGALSTIL